VPKKKSDIMNIEMQAQLIEFPIKRKKYIQKKKTKKTQRQLTIDN